MSNQVTVDDPIKSRHDLATTQATIKEILKDGTPDWFTHPEDYKNFAREAYLAEKEQSDAQARPYKLQDQEVFEDRAARMVHWMHGREFLKRLRDNGVRVFTRYAGQPGQAGLWAIVPTLQGAAPKYICFIQVPYMCEWSVVRLDSHGLAAGEDYRGWRTVLWRLIEEGVLTESKAHEIFGEPTGRAAKVYRRSLWHLRNNRGHNVK